MRNQCWSQPAARRGVSLLEVLISIGVTAVGLLGVMSLIPLAGAQARKGQISERATVIGQAGHGQMNAYGMADPNRWLKASGGTNGNGSLMGQLVGHYLPDPPTNNAPYTPTGMRAICIDPRGVAGNLADASNIDTFPYGTAEPRGMTRVTLNMPQLGGGMSKEMADYVFQSQDDLSLSLPSDRSMPAYQLMAPTDSSELTTKPDFTRRQFDGSMSWMVTLVPKKDVTDLYNRDLYTASTVVYHNRPPLGADVERTVNIAFHSAGIAGGDVELVGLWDVKPGNWLLLSGRRASGTNWYHRWYRVLGAAQDDSTNTTHVTLQGSDWDTTLVDTSAALVTGVVGVYETTVRLEGSTMWSN